jgi:hypothetical protein
MIFVITQHYGFKEEAYMSLNERLATLRFGGVCPVIMVRSLE